MYKFPLIRPIVGFGPANKKLIFAASHSRDLFLAGLFIGKLTLNTQNMRSFLVVLALLAFSIGAFSQAPKAKTVARPNIPGSFMVDLGINLALNKVDSTWKQGFWGSRTVNLYYQYPIRFGKSKFSFNPGIGLSMERWKFKNGAMLIDTVELNSFPNGAPSTNQVEQYNLLSPTRVYGQVVNKSMFVTNYLEIPIEFRFDSKPEDIARSFNVAIGGRVGVLFDSFTKVKYKENGEQVKVKDKYDHGLNLLRYGVYTRIGIGGFNWFGFYNLSQMFEKNKGPQGAAINTLTVGISINGF
jgi:hypothetical protein